jgi:glycosyltransferase involved in cell wall biosynthesis
VEASLGWETRLTVVGAVDDPALLDRFRHHPRVTLRGAVADTMPLYDSHRLFVAPSRVAAGLPYKVYEAAARGVPVVASALLRDDMGWEDGQELLSAPTDEPGVFAERIVTLYRDDALWQRLRESALARLVMENRPGGMETALRALLR